MSSPPNPPPPPPSRETDVAFGIILILMGLMLAVFLFFLPRIMGVTSKPKGETSTTSKAPTLKKPLQAP